MGMGGTTMTTTSAQRVRAHRARRRRREVQLTIEVSEIDLREIALRGYADAASTNRKARKGDVRRSNRHAVARPALDLHGKVADFGAQESINLPGIPFRVHTTLGY
jgi:hypothetical protein